jgi:hypothetical protein
MDNSRTKQQTKSVDPAECGPILALLPLLVVAATESAKRCDREARRMLEQGVCFTCEIWRRDSLLGKAYTPTHQHHHQLSESSQETRPAQYSQLQGQIQLTRKTAKFKEKQTMDKTCALQPMDGKTQQNVTLCLPQLRACSRNQRECAATWSGCKAYAHANDVLPARCGAWAAWWGTPASPHLRISASEEAGKRHDLHFTIILKGQIHLPSETCKTKEKQLIDRICALQPNDKLRSSRMWPFPGLASTCRRNEGGC